MISFQNHSDEGRQGVTNHDFVLAQDNTISTQLEVVCLSQSNEDGLEPPVGLVKVGGNLVAQKLVVGSHGAEGGHHKRFHGIAQVLILIVKMHIPLIHLHTL